MGVFRINPDERLDKALGKTLRKRTATTFTLAAELLKKKDAESVHQMRVSARRLNTLMKIFRPLYPRKGLKAHLQMLRSILDCSGSVRESDLLLELLESYRETLAQEEKPVIDLLIARRRLERSLSWKRLTQLLSQLQDENVSSEFEKFVNLAAQRR
jgi:CHAD domain-containing protein